MDEAHGVANLRSSRIVFFNKTEGEGYKTDFIRAKCCGKPSWVFVDFLSILTTTAPNLIRREHLSHDKGGHRSPSEVQGTHKGTFPFSYVMFTEGQILRMWGGGDKTGSYGSWETQNSTRNNSQPQKASLCRLHCTVSSEKGSPFWGKATAQKAWHHIQLMGGRGRWGRVAQEQSHFPKCWWQVQTPRSSPYYLNICSQVMSRQFVTTLVMNLEIVSTMGEGVGFDS